MPARHPSRSPLLIALLLAAPLFGPIARAQYGNTPCPSGTPLVTPTPTFTYDVASIHPHPSDDGSWNSSDPPSTRYDFTGVTMRTLIEHAYGVSAYQTSGGPAWIGSQHFDIHARSDESADALLKALPLCQARLVKRLALQALLADRIKLVTHRATREAPGYNLVIGKSGLKMHPSVIDPPPTDPTPEEAKAYASSQRPTMDMRTVKGGYRLNFKRHTIDSLVSYLADDLHAPVADKTGLTANYDISLNYAPDDIPANSAKPTRLDDEAFPLIFAALQEQLGLKLEPTKLPLEIIVIDHVEEPSAN